MNYITRYDINLCKKFRLVSKRYRRVTNISIEKINENLEIVKKLEKDLYIYKVFNKKIPVNKSNCIIYWFDKNNNLTRTYYFQDGKLHRNDGGPSIIAYEKNNEIFYKFWYKNGKIYKKYFCIRIPKI